MTKPYDLAVFIGRFQPFHDGHLAVVKQAMEIADEVLILIGSANRARDTRNPFTYEERKSLIEAATDADWPITIKAIPDSTNAEWISDVQHAVKRCAGPVVAPRVCIIGHERDHTSQYLRWFPQWPYVPVKDPTEVNATAIREAVLSDEYKTRGAVIGEIARLPVAIPLQHWLADFRKTDAWWSLKYEREAEIAYRERWGDKEPHVTADAVCVKSGHVLLIERGQYPGKGMLALPGGFKERGETLFQTACRELREETSLDLSDAVLAQFLRGSDVFDDPNRSRRGEIITRAFYFDLGDGPLPAVKGADDAARAFWLPISEVRVDTLFEDHAFIIRQALYSL